MNRFATGRVLRAFGVAALVGSAFSFATMTPASASTKTFTGVQCHGVLNGTALPDALIPKQNLTTGANSPGSVGPGDVFTVTFPSTSQTLPSSNSGTTITGYKNLSTTFKLNGSTFQPGTIATSGPPKINGVATTGSATLPTASTIKMSVPGPIKPGTLVSPTVTVKVKAGAGGSTISVNAIEAVTTASVSGLGDVTVTCPFPSDALTTTSVVTPGAPTAVDDSATTSPGTPVTIDVLANDKGNGFGQAPDASTLEVISPPSHGTATVSNGKIVYTPNSSFTTSDSFRYQVCIAVANTTTTTPPTTAVQVTQITAPPGTTLKCDPATVTVSAATVAGSTVPGATTPAAVSPAATSTLPRTGSSTMPLGILGAGLIAVGLAAFALARRRPAH